MIDPLFDASGLAGGRPSADFDELQAQLRHGLRDPLNAIKGYAELVLKELDELDTALARPDLEALLCDADALLSRIDVIVDFSSEPDGPLGEEVRGPVSSMIANLIRTVRPIEQYAAPRHESGRIPGVDGDASNRDLRSRRRTHDRHQVVRAESGHRGLSVLAIAGFDRFRSIS